MKLRIINAVLYTAMALFAASIIGAPLRLALRAITQRYSYTPDLEAPWVWVMLGLALVVAIASTAGRLVQGRRAGLIRYAMLIGVLAMSFAARKLVPAPSRPTVTDALSHLIARSELAADASFSREKRYPVDIDALTPQWADEIRDMGYFRRGGRLLRSRLFVVSETYGPVLVAPADARPGDVVFAVSSDRKRYWMTAFVLDRAGRLAPFTDSAGRAVVASAFDGRPASRLDPLFPEYPNKVPHSKAPF
jgi:hypothetical protein